MTKKRARELLQEIEEYYENYLTVKDDKYRLNTEYGIYEFWLDSEATSVFGRFLDVDKLKDIKRLDLYVNGNIYRQNHSPNKISGKLNFVWDDLEDMLDTLIRYA